MINTMWNTIVDYLRKHNELARPLKVFLFALALVPVAIVYRSITYTGEDSTYAIIYQIDTVGSDTHEYEIRYRYHYNVGYQKNECANSEKIIVADDLQYHIGDTIRIALQKDSPEKSFILSE
jgi:hypothetical protein